MWARRVSTMCAHCKPHATGAARATTRLMSAANRFEANIERHCRLGPKRKPVPAIEIRLPSVYVSAKPAMAMVGNDGSDSS